MSGRQPLDHAEAWALLAAAPMVRVAGAKGDTPILRTMHHVVHDGAVWLHGAPGISLAELEGTRVAVSAEEVVARIPSWMRDPERACPATTYYRSAWVQGVLLPVEDTVTKAAVLQRMMEVLEPEGFGGAGGATTPHGEGVPSFGAPAAEPSPARWRGGHLPIEAEHRLYRGALRGLGVWKIEPDSVSAVAKLGQDQPVDHVREILGALWRRGGPGDVAAIEQISAAHPQRPTFVDLPSPLRPRCHPSEHDVASAVALARGRYWNRSFGDDELADAVRHASAWVGLERSGRLVASARAISDRTKRSWVYDVVVADDLQRSGVGTVLMNLLLDHPMVRRTEVSLATRDAAGFYERLGFRSVWTDTTGEYPRTQLVRPRTQEPVGDWVRAYRAGERR